MILFFSSKPNDCKSHNTHTHILTAIFFQVDMSYPVPLNFLILNFIFSLTCLSPSSATRVRAHTHTHTHTNTHLTALCPGLPRSASTRMVKPVWILLKQERVSGSGISWAQGCGTGTGGTTRLRSEPEPEPLKNHRLRFRNH